MDTAETWSRDGRWILFRRLLATSAGPPGLYAVHVNGGPPRYVAPASILWPREFRFSPDGRTIAAVDGRQLIIIDFESGSIRRPLYVRSGIASADWSPDGSRLVYERLTSSDPTPDSSGLHIFDLTTGGDLTLKARGTLLYGPYPRWSPDGREIVWIAPTSVNRRIAAYSLDSDTVRVFFGSPRNTVLDDLDLYRNRIFGTTSYMFFQINGPGAGAYLVDADGTRLRRFPYVLGPYDRVAPDGEQFVTPWIDTKDSVAVLLLKRFDDFSGSWTRQLTYYSPPASSSSPITQKEASPWSGASASRP